MDRDFLLRVVGSLAICEDLSDVADVVGIILEKVGMTDIVWSDLAELGTELGKRGITTVWGTKLGED